VRPRPMIVAFVGLIGCSADDPGPSTRAARPTIVGTAGASCRVIEGSVECSWSDARAKVLVPDGTAPGTFVPISIPGRVDHIDVSPVATHACASSDDGAVYCWGANEHGQAGRELAPDVSAETRVFPPWRVSYLHDVRAVATGIDASCALDRRGAVYCWGNLAGAELRGIAQTARPVMMAVRGAIAIATDGMQFCALEPDGARCWGGQIPDRRTGRQVSTDGVRLVRATRGAVSLRSEAFGVICAIWSDGTERCWSTTYLPLSVRHLPDG